jgi:hypothetical protein
MTTSTNKITESIITKLQGIPLDKQRQVLEYIESIAKPDSSTSENPNPSSKQRIFGLHKEKIWISDDFNDPLPDEFWNFDS